MPPTCVISDPSSDVGGRTVSLGCAWVRTDVGPEQVSAALGGELDVSGSHALVEAMSWAITSSGAATLALDLSELTFIDASGVGALLQVEHAARAHQCELVLTNPQPMITRVFEICGLGHHLEPGGTSALIS